jgi:hypothetical protein
LHAGMAEKPPFSSKTSDFLDFSPNFQHPTPNS